MGVLTGLVEWAQATFGPYGVLGLIVLAVTEAIVSPIPPDILLPVLALDQPWTYALYLGVITTVASVAGGAVGYWLGKEFSPWVHRRFAGPKLAKVEGWYDEHGEWIVLLAAFTPLPFKIFTVTSGLLRLRFWPFMAAAVVGRGLRFIPEALLSAYIGQEAIAWLERSGYLVLGLTALAAVAWYLWRHARRGDGAGSEA